MAIIKIASFNVENLFQRPKVFNFSDHKQGDQVLKDIARLSSLLRQKVYDADTKKEILKLNKKLKDYMFIREDRAKLFKKQGWTIKGVAANGAGEWDGSIELKKAKYSETGRQNTAKVLKKVNADIACVIEADNRIALRAFDAHLLGYKYDYEMLIDGNDNRGIDVGIMSQYVFGSIKTHIYDRANNKRVFSRDCLEIEVLLPNGRSIFFLVNHFKSKGYDYDGTSAEKRKRQAKRVSEILAGYDLQNDYVVVAGDLNDTPDSDALEPLTSIPLLHDVLELKHGANMGKRWTYHYKSFEQIDFVMVSDALKNAFVDAGVERRGIFKLKALTEASPKVDNEQSFSSVNHKSNQASDHGAVWAEFDII